VLGVMAARFCQESDGDVCPGRISHIKPAGSLQRILPWWPRKKRRGEISFSFEIQGFDGQLQGDCAIALTKAGDPGRR